MILVLKYKHGDYPVYARTPEEELRAYLHLFNLMNKWGFYAGMDGDMKDWYDAAKNGDMKAARQLLRCRSSRGYEYEYIDELYPLEP